MAGSIGIMIDLRPHALEEANTLTFGACLSAGPVKDNAGNWPPVDWAPVAAPEDSLAPYKPWTWNWADNNLLADPPADRLGWSVWVRHSAKPAAWHRLAPALIRSVDSVNGLPSSLAGVYTATLNKELVNLKLLKATGDFQESADSTNFSLLWKGTPTIREGELPTSDDSDPNDPGFRSDRLMSALARWSISRPPLNFAARLTWGINLIEADVQTFLTTLAGQQGWPDTQNIEFAAIPFRGDHPPTVTSIGSALASAVLPPWDPNAPAGSGVEIRLACNSTRAPVSPAAGGTVDPELDNWRRLMASRLARFFALPDLILELAGAPDPADPQLPRWQQWSATSTLTDRAVVLRNLWTWIAAGSADIFSASALGGTRSWWNQCAATVPPPPLFTTKRGNALEWVTWLNAVTTPSDKPLPKTGYKIPASNQWQLLFDLTNAVTDRLTKQPSDFEALLTADASGRAELTLMADFLHNLQAPEIIRVLLPELWMESGAPQAVVDKLVAPGPVPMLGGDVPDETIQPALAVARVRAHWDALFGGHVNNYLDTLSNKIGGATGIIVSTLYQLRTGPAPANDVLRPASLPDLGPVFAADLGNLLPPDLKFTPPKPGPDRARDWLAGDMSQPIVEPHGITLPLASEEPADESGHEIKSDDSLQENAGYVVFGRETAISKWRCLTQVKPTDDSPVDWDIVMAVPLDLGFQDGRLACTVTYNNHPLAALSPADELVKHPANRLEQLDPPKWDRPLIRYEMPAPDPVRNTGLLPGLVYGRSYEFAALPLKNSGILPVALRNGHPASLEFRKLLDPAFTWSGVPGVILYNTRTYLRRVGIGAPRVANWTVNPPLPSAAPPAKWPQLPPGVLPLAAEIRRPEQDDISTRESEEPVALLFSPGILRELKAAKRSATTVNALTLELNKPISDLENWDRWVAKDLADDAGKRLRSEVWARVYQERDDVNKKNSKMSPDDPAVGDYLLFQFEQLHAPPNAAVPSPVLYVAKYTPDPALKFQSLPIKLAITAVDGEDSSFRIAKNQGAISVSVPEGQVWRVTLYNLVPARFLAGGTDPRLDYLVFDQKVLSTVFAGKTFQGEADVTGHLGDWFACSSHTFRVETVSNSLPGEKDLWKALAPGESGDQIQLRLDYSSLTDRRIDFVSSMDIRHQIWRWNGRPAETDQVTPPGSRGTTVPDDDYSRWDGIGFHDREDSQHRLIRQRLIYREIPDVSVQPLPKGVIFTDDRSGDRRALYSRFGLTAYSRYYSVTEKSVTARCLRQSSNGKESGNVFDPWRRHLLKERLTQPLKRPLIRGLLPITSSENLGIANPLLNPGSSPGLMLLLAEPFYQQAGIVEQLECQVMSGTVKEPDSSGVIYEHDYLMAGFDPIVSKKKLHGSYGLSLLSLASPNDLTKKAESLLIVALVGCDLHIRIFDEEGEIVIDKSEAELVPGQAMTRLREMVDAAPFPDAAKFSSGKRRRTVDDALSAIGHEATKHLLKLDPPVGLTFDVGATDPHIVSSCFFGRVPEGFHAGFAESSGRTGATAANTFFKVHVRRAVRPRTKPAESSAETEAREALASEWTESEWVRLLPDASALLLAWPTGDDGFRSVVLDNNGTLVIPGWNNPLPWPVENAGDFLAKRFSYALLVSRLLPDTSGRLREIYQCALRGDESGNFASFANENTLAIASSEETVLIRIIELFHREPLQPNIDLWQTLFPKEPEQPEEPREDAGARIDRMSSPFEVTLKKM